jgi:hypothetical protein
MRLNDQKFFASFFQKSRPFLRDAAWLTRERVHAYARVLIAVSLLFFAVSIDWRGSALPVAYDFAAFWTAANLALRGHAVLAYGDAARQAVAALFGPGYYPPFFYTPVALLFWLPFAFLQAGAAAALWVGGTAAAYALTLRAMLGGRFVLQLLAFPSVLICALYGQNGLCSAALFGGIALTLDRAPFAAGVLIGGLAYKPQLGVLVPLALVCAGRWRTFAAAAVSVVSLSAVAALVFGAKIWSAFLANLPLAQAWNANGVPGFDRFVSPYAAARLFGAPAAGGWLAQAAFAVPACLALVWTVRRRPGAAAETAMLVVATSFCVPFLGEYDLCILAVPGTWIAAEALKHGWLPYERITLAALTLSPLAIKAAALHAIPVAPVAMTVLAWMVVRRIQVTGNSFR